MDTAIVWVIVGCNTVVFLFALWAYFKARETARLAKELAKQLERNGNGSWAELRARYHDAGF